MRRMNYIFNCCAGNTSLRLSTADKNTNTFETPTSIHASSLNVFDIKNTNRPRGDCAYRISEYQKAVKINKLAFWFKWSSKFRTTSWSCINSPKSCPIAHGLNSKYFFFTCFSSTAAFSPAHPIAVWQEHNLSREGCIQEWPARSILLSSTTMLLPADPTVAQQQRDWNVEDTAWFFLVVLCRGACVCHKWDLPSPTH